MKLLAIAILIFSALLISFLSDSGRSGDEVSRGSSVETIRSLTRRVQVRDMIGNIQPSRRPTRTPSGDE